MRRKAWVWTDGEELGAFVEHCVLSASENYTTPATLITDDELEAMETEVERLRRTLENARDAIASLPKDALGSNGCGTTLPSGEAGWMDWPVRDELLDKINRALDPGEEEGLGGWCDVCQGQSCTMDHVTLAAEREDGE